jgi:hypothetical protein
MNRDFVEMLSAFCEVKVEFLFVANKRASGRPKDLLDLALLDEFEAARRKAGS